MEPVTERYKDAVRAYLEEWVEYHPDERTGIPLTIIEDKANGYFLLTETGFGRDGWVNSLFVAFKVTESGKVILLENYTDQEPLEELMEKGGKAEDFLLAWAEPSVVKAHFEVQAA